MNRGGNILIFDGVCNLCNGLVRFLAKKDRRSCIRFIPYQSITGQLLLKKFNISGIEIDSVIYISDYNIYFNSSAVLTVLKDIGGVWKMFYFLIIIPGFIRNFLYSFIAHNRYVFFGKRDTCAIPERDIENGYL